MTPIPARHMLCVLLMAATCGCQPTTQAATRPTRRAESKEAFLARYQAAHEAGDVDAAMRLVCWDGVDKKTKSFFRKNFETDFQAKFTSARLEPPAKGQWPDYEQNGVRYTTNLDVVASLMVEMVQIVKSTSAPSTTSYPVGLKEGRYCITTATPAAK